METILVTIPVAASALLEGIKWLYRRFIAKDPDFQFPMNWYAFLLPLCQVAVAPVLFWLGFVDTLPVDYDFSSVMGVTRTVLVVAIQSVLSVIAYENSIKVLKEAGHRKVEEDTGDGLPGGTPE